jgi:NDP-sugar pyrophosphorylase family protein
MNARHETSAIPIRQAVLLAAGLGTRLRPLTLTTPKPLLPLDGTCLIDHQLRSLVHAGIERVAINLHHLGEKIRDHVGEGARYGLTIVYSEEPLILGTGGGVKQAAALLDRGPVIVLNSDALLAADIGALAAQHLRSGAAATMAVKKLSAGMSYKALAIDEAGRVTDFGSGEHFFTGLHVVGEALLDLLPPVGTPACMIQEGYQECLERDLPVGAFFYEGYFNDLGTPARYDEARADIREGRLALFKA